MLNVLLYTKYFIHHVKAQGLGQLTHSKNGTVKEYHHGVLMGPKKAIAVTKPDSNKNGPLIAKPTSALNNAVTVTVVNQVPEPA